MGKIRGKEDSWAALSTCKGLSGVVFDGKEMYYIAKGSSFNENSTDYLNVPHFLYKHGDLAENNKTCGYVGAERAPHVEHDEHDFRENEYNRILRVSTNSKNIIFYTYSKRCLNILFFCLHFFYFLYTSFLVQKIDRTKSSRTL